MEETGINMHVDVRVPVDLTAKRLTDEEGLCSRFR
jgi:hypothetical protein